jgi:radical SAM protein with 4Fe4S-binding SPASM domain
MSSPIPIKMTCAPMYTRVIAQQQKQTGESAHFGGGRGCMAGNGFCFVSHVGDVFGCGFLPVSVGNVRRQSFKDIYRSPLFAQLRNRSLLEGKCGGCGFKETCGGCRARALSVHGSFLAEEPFCVYEP